MILLNFFFLINLENFREIMFFSRRYFGLNTLFYDVVRRCQVAYLHLSIILYGMNHLKSVLSCILTDILDELIVFKTLASNMYMNIQ